MAHLAKEMARNFDCLSIVLWESRRNTFWGGEEMLGFLFWKDWVPCLVMSILNSCNGLTLR